MAPREPWPRAALVCLLEPALNKLATTAIVGLVVLFPIFNEVSRTALDTLYNADHQAKLDRFFKGWDDIPEDEKLEYWDGRTAPPGQSEGEFDRDDLDDDFRTREDGEPRPGDRDGDGVPDEEDPDPDDPEIQDEDDVIRYEERSQVLWSFNGTGTSEQNDGQQIVVNRIYDSITVRYEWEGFSGTASFQLSTADGSQVWNENSNSGVPAVDDDEDLSETAALLQNYGDALQMAYDYQPLAQNPPTSYSIMVIGYYEVVVEEDA